MRDLGFESKSVEASEGQNMWGEVLSIWICRSLI